jgi:transketolase
MSFASSVHAKAIELIRLAIEMTTAAGSGHPTSAASLAHLTVVLLYDRMRFDPSYPDDPAADRLVLSEGHACPIIYAAAADLGIAIGSDPDRLRPMTRDDAMHLREISSPIDGHPNPAEGFPFFPAATGSLGQGLSVAAGLAVAARLDGLDRRVYCLIGDGESREGQIWEAIDFIADYHLSAVCPVFNCNGFGQASHVSPQQSPATTAAKLRAAGFDVYVIDGHDPGQINEAFAEHQARSRNPSAKPVAIVAKTVKGWGFVSVVGTDAHGRPVRPDELNKAFAELDAAAQRVGAHWTEGDLERSPVEANRPPTPTISRAPGLEEALAQFERLGVLTQAKVAPRKAYGVALQALGHADSRIVALDGDVRNSTFSDDFYRDPALRERFFECRIAEQNMVSCAAGLCASGKIPFVSTFGKFLGRAYDQLEMALISRFNLKLVGSHVGTSLASDGPSQMALTDVSYFSAWAAVRNPDGSPFLYVLTPADVYAAYALTIAMAEHAGPCYLRTLRPDVPMLYDASTHFSLGGHQVLVEGNDLLLAASGYMVHETQKAVALLRDEGIHASLVDLYSLPFDPAAIVSLCRHNSGRVLVVEDNFGGGLGEAVALALGEQGGDTTINVRRVERIPKSGRSPDDLLRYLHLSASDIAAAARAMVEPAAVGKR